MSCSTCDYHREEHRVHHLATKEMACAGGLDRVASSLWCRNMPQGWGERWDGRECSRVPDLRLRCVLHIPRSKGGLPSDMAALITSGWVTGSLCCLGTAGAYLGSVVLAAGPCNSPCRKYRLPHDSVALITSDCAHPSRDRVQLSRLLGACAARWRSLRATHQPRHRPVQRGADLVCTTLCVRLCACCVRCLYTCMCAFVLCGRSSQAGVWRRPTKVCGRETKTD